MGIWSRLKMLLGVGSDPHDVPAGRRRVPVSQAYRARDEEEETEEERPRRRVTKIRREIIELIRAMGRDAFPNEFGATLRAEGDTVTEVILVPGTLGGDRHAILPLYSLPVDRSIVGTVHSHPSPNPEPSDADLQLFRHFGHTHIIIAAPYSMDSWVAYDHDGDVIELDLV